LEVTLNAGVKVVGVAQGPPEVAPYSNWNVVEVVWVDVTCHPQMLID
jgi:hypothetical protein